MTFFDMLIFAALLKAPGGVLATIAAVWFFLFVIGLIFSAVAYDIAENNGAMTLFFLSTITTAVALVWLHFDPHSATAPRIMVAVAVFFILALIALHNSPAERRAREAATAAWKAEEARRIYPPTRTWDVALLAGSPVILLVGGIIGTIVVASNHINLPFAGDIIAAALIVTIASFIVGPSLAIFIKARRRRALPAGVIGRTKDGVYVYDLDRMKAARGNKPSPIKPAWGVALVLTILVAAPYGLATYWRISLPPSVENAASLADSLPHWGRATPCNPGLLAYSRCP
jgi:hypothetical protein